MDLFLGIKKYLFHFLRFNFKRIHYFVLCLLTSQFLARPLTLKLVLGKGFGLCLDSFLCWPLLFWVGPCGGGRECEREGAKVLLCTIGFHVLFCCVAVLVLQRLHMDHL